MINKLKKVFKNPTKAWRFFTFFLKHYFRKRKGILVMIGVEPGGVLSLMHWGFTKCYCFEANPERYVKLKKKYSKYSYIKLYNKAVAQYDGEVIFNISNNNNGASSSIGSFDENWVHKHQGKKVEMIKSIKVPCINLNTFFQNEKIDYIDTYVSDIQGMDLEVLKTLKPMIDRKKIGTITCEVALDEKRNIYKDLPSNTESNFKELLGPNYNLVAKGWGILKDGRLEEIPPEAWEMDCKWRVK